MASTRWPPEPRRSRPASAVPAVLAGAAVLAQIAYPLTHGHTRTTMTIIGVATFFAASTAHAAIERGAGMAARMVLLTAGGGLLAEAVGVASGVPFGRYHYTRGLGWSFLGVPIVIPLAWTMMSWPALIVGRRVARARSWTRRASATGDRTDRSGRLDLTAIVVAAAALVGWDLFLDPQMVAAGNWVWAPTAAPHLNGIPITNTVGWAAVALALMVVLSAAVPPAPLVTDDRVPLGLFAWTYFSEVLGQAAFFGHPAVALAGGVGMGAVMAALVRSARSPSLARS